MGRLIARALGAFTEWALSRGHLNPDDPTHAAPDFRGYVIRDQVTSEPYMTRILLPKIGSWRPFLHHIHRSDHERDLHNHPWLWAFSIILSGEYDEERLVGDGDQIARKRARRLNVLTSRDYHRITELHGDVWTLFVHGPSVQTWGFRVRDIASSAWRWVMWRDYIAQQTFKRRLAMIPQMDAAALDAWGKIFNCPRQSVRPANSSFPAASYPMESDDAYRTRLREALTRPL